MGLAMGFLDNIKQTMNQLPYLRKPRFHSQYENYLSQYGWTLQKRNKNVGIGWNTYYQAMNNVWVSACIKAYLNTVTNLDYLIHNPNNETVNTTRQNYLNNLFENPMGLDSNITYEIYQKLMWGSFLGLGDAFSEIIFDPKYDKVPIGFNHIPTHLITYYSDTDQWGLVNNGKRFEKNEIIHVKEPDIQGSVWGVSNIDILASDITMEILGREHTKELLENKGLDPRGILEFDADIDDELWNQQIERLQAQASTNRHGTMITRGGHYSKIANSNEDMQYIDLMHEIRDRILAVYSVPPAWVSIIETANLGSGSGLAQDKQFKKTFKGVSKLFEKAYTKPLGRSIFDEIFEYADLDIQDMKERAEIENIRINNGSLTINEVRTGYGQEPVAWGDENINSHISLNKQETNNLKKTGLILDNKYY